MIAASTRIRSQPGRAERESGNITPNTGREPRTAIKEPRRSLTKPPPGKPLKVVNLFVAVQNKADRTFPKVGQVNSAASRVAREASRAPQTEPGGTRSVARVLSREVVRGLSEEGKVVVK